MLRDLNLSINIYKIEREMWFCFIGVSSVPELRVQGQGQGQGLWLLRVSPFRRAACAGFDRGPAGGDMWFQRPEQRQSALKCLHICTASS